MHITIINEKGARNLKDSKEGFMGRFKGRKAEENGVIIILKIKEIILKEY